MQGFWRVARGRRDGRGTEEHLTRGHVDAETGSSKPEGEER